MVRVADVALSSTRNPRVRAAAALRERRARDETGLTLIDGVRELARAVAGGARVVEVFVDRDRLGPDGTAAVDAARAAGAEVVEVSAVVVDHLAYGDRGEGIVAVAAIPDMSLEALSLPADPLVVVIEGVEKPGNLGAVLRSADGAGADAVIAADPRTDLFNPNAVRASQGTVFAIPVAGASSAEVRAWLRRAGVRVLAARVGGAVDYVEANLRGPVAIVLGSEAAGLSDAWSGDDVAAIGLPMLGVADSLNVSIAAAVLLYEARRQRGGPRDGRAATISAPGD
jgi:TrmH family RNA methyltransferase